MKKLLPFIVLLMLFAFNANAAQAEIPMNYESDTFISELAELAILVEIEDDDDIEIEFD